MIASTVSGPAAQRRRQLRRAAARQELLDGLARNGAYQDHDPGRTAAAFLTVPPLDDPLEGLLVDEDAASPASLTIADVIRTFGPEYRRRAGHRLSVQQDRALRELTACQTPLLGTHTWTCQHCGTVVELPNACHNRHCPSCGEGKRKQWAQATASRLLPVEYYHVMLTVPQQLTQLAIAYPRVLYPIMLRSGAEAILGGGRELFDAELALLSLLHSSGSALNAHLHVHSMLPAGGLRRRVREWMALSRKQIEDVLLLASTTFPRRFIKALQKAYDQGLLPFDGDPQRPFLRSRADFDQWLASFNTTRWMIRCPQVWDRRAAADDPQAAQKTVRYLANYANRVALSNDRIVGIEGRNVLLRYKDYRDGDRWKTQPIDGVDFLGRFLQHLIPRRMHHIRRYGWMGNRADSEKLSWLREYFHGADSQDGGAPPDAENGDAEPLEPAEQSRPCRQCAGTMVLTDRTLRPKVSEILRMPWKWIAEARRGPIVTLGAQLAAAQQQSAPRSIPSIPEAAKAEAASRETSPRPASAFW